MTSSSNFHARLLSTRVASRGLRAFVLAALVSLTTLAAAQQCTYEAEPNNTPAEATFITGVGPDGVGTAPNAKLGTVCLAGALEPGDQDSFWWDVGEVAAGHQWSVSIEGISGQQTKLSIFRIQFADNGVDVTAADELHSFSTQTGQPATSKPLLLEPGRYLIGVAASGGSGQYVVNLRPQDLAYRTSAFSSSAWRGEFRAFGDVPGESQQRFEVTEGDAGFAWGLELETALGTSLELVLEGPGGQIGSARATADAPARLTGYALAPGAYVARIVGTSAAARLTVAKQGRVGDGQELEPNNDRSNATQFPLGSQIRGMTEDEDWFMVEVSEADAARPWDLVIEPSAEVEVRLFDNANTELLRRRYAANGVAEGLHLNEGVHYLSVRYVRGGADYGLEWRQATPAAQGMTEREPNDQHAQATDIGVQAEARGFLADQDIDFYRFEVEGQAQLYRLQTVGQGVTRLIVYAGGGSEIARTTGQGRLRLDDVLLLPGAQYVSVEGEGEYALRAIPIGPAPAATPAAAMPAATEPLSPAAAAPAEPGADDPVTGSPAVEQPVRVPPPPGLLEFEPNNDESRAHRLLPGVVHVGRLHDARDEDYYRVFLPGDQYVRIELVPPAGDESLAFDIRGEDRFSAPAGEGGQPVVAERWLEAGDHSLFVHGRTIRGEVPAGYYQLRLTLLGAHERPDDQVTADSLTVTLDAPADELAAYWHEGQRVEATATVHNSGSEAQSVSLTAAVNHARVTVDLAEDITVQPGQSVQVPVTLAVPADIRDDVPLVLQVGASGAAGTASARRDFSLLCEAPPVQPFPYHSLPGSMLGRPNVLWSGLGSAIHGDSSWARRDEALTDGRTTISYGGYAGSDHSPTFVLAGDAPVVLVGTSLTNQSNVDRTGQVRDFTVETSLDGITFSPVFEGRLQAAQFEQVFEFDEPVTARFARLVAPGRGYVGEWKLYAQDPSLFSGLDIARPDLGGYVVWSEPVLGGQRSGGILDPETRANRQDVRDLEGLSFVIGFNHARAAMVQRLEWRESEAGLAAPDALAQTVVVESSLGGGAGPWENVAEWQLERDRSGVASLEFEQPIWARYLRFSVPKGASTHLFEPQQVSVFEAEVGTNGYLSILGEWGNMVKDASYELLVDSASETAAARTVTGNHSRQAAAQLQPGVPVRGTVVIGENVDWYKVTVPQGQNHVSLRLAGDPSIAYAYELTDSTGRLVLFEARSEGEEELLTFFAEPGDYYLKIEEPKRTVIFSWDTSGSVGPYIPITYNSLASFALGVDGEREAVQLLAYNDPRPDWLLPFWSSDPLRVQRAIQEYDRRGDSSNTEVALLTATQALADREGTRAILLITDAESGGHNLNPQLWRALEDVRPRVFTFEISSSGNDYAQDMMQSYAAVNGGHYETTAGVGDFDAGFARASCLLRRPKGYEVEVALGFVPPPGPGMLSVVPAPGAAQAAVEVVFDASGSMGQLLPSGEQRIAAAKRALEALVGEVLPEGTPFALRAFGHVTPAACETRLDVPFAELNREKAMAAVAAIEPKLLSGTPIAESLTLVAQDLAKAQGGRQVILITDGEESCGGDPAEAVRQLRAAGPLSLAIVSLALEPDALAVFEKLAQDVGATYVDVGSYEALSAAIVEALNPAFEVYDQEGALVAQGRVGGEAVELPMGVYRVRVLSAPVEVFDNVRVPGDGSVTVNAGR